MQPPPTGSGPRFTNCVLSGNTCSGDWGLLRQCVTLGRSKECARQARMAGHRPTRAPQTWTLLRSSVLVCVLLSVCVRPALPAHCRAHRWTFCLPPLLRFSC